MGYMRGQAVHLNCGRSHTGSIGRDHQDACELDPSHAKYRSKCPTKHEYNMPGLLMQVRIT